LSRPPSPPRKGPSPIKKRAAERRALNRRKPDVVANVRIALLLLLAAQCLRVTFFSPRLAIREVRLSGTHRYTAQDMIRLGQVPIGRNLFRVNLARVAERLQAEPALKRVMVTREFPGALRIDVEERLPAFQVASGDSVFNADVEGVLFEPAPPASALPSLQVEPGDLPALGQAVDPELASAVAQCGRLAKKERLAIGKMRVDASRELWLNVATPPDAGSDAGSDAGPEPAGLDVRVGRMTDLPEKFRDIRQCLSAWPDLPESAAYLNVMSPGNPSKMPRSALKNGQTAPPGAAPLPGPAQAAAPDAAGTKTP